MTLTDLRVCGVERPLGFLMEKPVLSWTVEGASGAPVSASVTVRAHGAALWDSGEVRDADSLGWALPLSLAPRTCYELTLSVRTDRGETASAESSFETGKRDEPWTAEWISPRESQVSAVLRRRFRWDGEDGPARLYVCGLGVYELRVNGEKAGNEFLAPGYHSYDFYLGVQTYDLDTLLRPGENELRIVLGEGWFKGRLGFDGGFTNLYGDRLYAIAELWCGGRLILKTGGDWEELESAVTFANIYDGEVFDARRLPEKRLGPAELAAPGGCGPLRDRVNLPVKRMEALPVREVLRTPKGDTVLDFGQNLTGWVEFDCALPAGEAVKLTAGEILQEGEFYRENYRTAKAEFTYISDGRSRRVRPHFTFYGFRYMKLECAVPLPAEAFTACHLRSDFPRTAEFTCGNAKVERLWRNAVWGMQDNLLDVPTDCPQRDERLGWTGDAQAISETACQTFGLAAFYRKYLTDMRCEQSALNGSGPNVVPRIKKPFVGEHGASPWADAAVILPWTVWTQYGDRALLEEMYPGMRAWLEHQRRRAQGNLIADGFHFADWLALDAPEPGPFGRTDPLFIASAYYHRCALLCARAAEALGRPEAAGYEALAGAVLAALREKYFDENGLCRVETQTAAALSVMFGLTTDEQAQGRALRALVERRGGHLDTGFVGTPLLCPALSRTGNADLAVTVLLQEDYPGWLYSVDLGATTIWERWNSVLPDGRMNPEGMNSLNHYTYGSIAVWLYGWLCGLRPLAPGWRRAELAPLPDRRLGRARTRLRTASGVFVSGWEYAGDRLIYEASVPCGASALLRLPGRAAEELGPGQYRFEADA